VDSPRGPLQVPARIPPGVDRACSLHDQGLGGLPDHLPLVMSWGGSLRVPYIKRVRGSLRVVL
jgi:hypothetical protein